MIFPSILDVCGERWWRVNNLVEYLTGIGNNNAHRTLKGVNPFNITRFWQIVIVQPVSVTEQKNTRYINRNGVIEFYTDFHTRRPEATSKVEDFIKILNKHEKIFKEIHTPDVYASQPRYKFYEDVFRFKDDDELPFNVRPRVIYDKTNRTTWVEGSQLLRKLGYASPSDAIHLHVSPENKRRLHWFFDNRPYVAGAQQDQSYKKPRANPYMINGAGFLQLSTRCNKPEFRKFWAVVCKEIDDRFDVAYDERRREITVTRKRIHDGGDDERENKRARAAEMDLALCRKEREVDLLKHRHTVKLLRMKAQIDVLTAQVGELSSQVELYKTGCDRNYRDTMMWSTKCEAYAELSRRTKGALLEVAERVVAPLEIEKKVELLAVFENSAGTLKVVRGQRQHYDALLLKLARRPTEKDNNQWYGDRSYRLVDIPVECPNAVNMWLYVRTQRVEEFGLWFDPACDNKTTVRRLGEDELRAKYRRLRELSRRKKVDRRHSFELQRFIAMCFVGEEDFVARAMVRSASHLVSVMKGAVEEIVPRPPPPPAVVDDEEELMRSVEGCLRQRFRQIVADEAGLPVTTERDRPAAQVAGTSKDVDGIPPTVRESRGEFACTRSVETDVSDDGDGSVVDTSDDEDWSERRVTFACSSAVVADVPTEVDRLDAPPTGED